MMLSFLSFFLLTIFGTCNLDDKIKFLDLPTWSQGFQSISDSSEITPEEIEAAYNTFSYPLNPKSYIIISSRFSTFEEQFNHFIFGSALAYALNRSIKIEMRHYPLSQPQPQFLFEFQNLNKPQLIDTDSYKRIRVARELFCKNESYFQTDSPSIPILIRNYDDITTLYGNHFLGQRLRKLFGFHSAYFLSNYFINLTHQTNDQYVIGINPINFNQVRKMTKMKNISLIVDNFVKTVQKVDPESKSQIVIVSNDQDLANQLKERLVNAVILENDIEGVSKLVAAKTFIGTYRSKFSQSINMMRGVPGYLVNTNSEDVIIMSNSQTGVLQPYYQDVEDVEFTINEKLRGCEDNIDDLRYILDNFIL